MTVTMAARRKKRRRELSVGLLSVGAEEGWGVSVVSLMADLLFRDRVESVPVEAQPAGTR